MIRDILLGWPGLVDRWLASGGIWEQLALWVVRFPLIAFADDPKSAARQALLAALQHGRIVVPDSAHPLVRRLADPRIQAELAAVREHCDREEPAHLEPGLAARGPAASRG